MWTTFRDTVCDFLALPLWPGTTKMVHLRTLLGHISLYTEIVWAGSEELIRYAVPPDYCGIYILFEYEMNSGKARTGCVPGPGPPSPHRCTGTRALGAGVLVVEFYARLERN